MMFRRAVAEHLGSALTPEVAAAIERAASVDELDSAIDVGMFAPEVHGDYRIAVERFSAVLPELHRLHEHHWLETERHRNGLTLDPDYAAMEASERAGRMLQFTVRKDGALVGNLRMYLATSRHTKTLVAHEDTLYLEPVARGGFLAMHLLRYAERALLRLGVVEIRADSKLVNNADVLMRRMGYQPVALQFVKMIKEPTHVQ